MINGGSEELDEICDRIVVHDKFVFAQHFRTQNNGADEVEGTKQYGYEVFKVAIVGSQCHRDHGKAQAE